MEKKKRRFLNDSSNIVMSESESSGEDMYNSSSDDYGEESSYSDRYSFESDTYNKHAKSIYVQKGKDRSRQYVSKPY